MTIRAEKIYKELIINTLGSISDLNKCRKHFLCEILVLFLSIKGRINFLQLARFGNFTEQRYRQQFEKPFAFLDFNKQIVLSKGGGKYAIAFDPSYIPKSGKKTTGLGWYWSGCAGQAKWGLEIGGIAAIDINNHTAFHLEAMQTLNNTTANETLMQWYINLLKERQDALRSISRYITVDAWFSKKPFVDATIAMQMHIISRLRDDADLRYKILVCPTGKRGRPKKYGDKINPKELDMLHFKLISNTEESCIHSAIVYSKSLKREIHLVHVEYKSTKGKRVVKLYFSTDCELPALDVLEYYQSRFQIEFLYRDGKQFTGLADVQARSENKLNFHFNAALTAINIAKVEHWLSIPKAERTQFSMSDIKTLNHNRLLLQRFIDVFGVNPNTAKNKLIVKELIYYGTIAA